MLKLSFITRPARVDLLFLFLLLLLRLLLPLLLLLLLLFFSFLFYRSSAVDHFGIIPE